MTVTIIIAFCVLLLLAYFFDISSPKTNIPSVVLLLLSGWLVRQTSLHFEINIPDLTPLLPGLGTIGLILIVLEGSLELEFNSSKFKLVRNAITVSLLSILTLTFLIGCITMYFSKEPLNTCLINAVPLCIISSAIAISSAKTLEQTPREFIVYESSLSDIFGVLLFNFLTVNEVISWGAIGTFFFQLFFILIVSLSATLILGLLLHRINHKVKFAPIILLIILIYEVSKVYHLPALVFILIFGLVIGNLDEFKKNSWLKLFHTEALNVEVNKFRELTGEATFLVRSVFFLLFGFLIETEEILNFETFIWSSLIVLVIFIIRYFILKALKLPLNPLLFFAPRGLITILLFLAIDNGQRLALINRSLIIQVILITSVVMMIGIIHSSRKKILS